MPAPLNMRRLTIGPSGATRSLTNSKNSWPGAISNLPGGPEAELGDDPLSQARRRQADRHNQRVLVGLRLLQHLELVLEQRDGHEMLTPALHALADQLEASLQEDQAHVRAVTDQAAAVAALQCRAGDQSGLTLGELLVDPLGNGIEPRPAVVVIERKATPHLFDIGGRMEAVGIAKGPAKQLCQPPTDRGLARTR